MNRIKTFAVALLFLLFGALAWAQEPRDDSKPQQDSTKQEEAKPEPKHEAAPPARENEMKPPQQEEGNPPKSEKKEESAKPSRDEAKPAHEEHGQEPAKGQAAQSGGHARPSGKSVHIPDQKFKASFGRQHTMKANQVITQTTIVPGQTQFVYGGYTFVILDPWPSDWMFTDEVYIDYVDGDYFLFNASHPGVQIALFVQG